MFLSDISIKRPVMITMVMAALLLFGILAYLNLPLNLMPDAKFPIMTVQTIYPGASPEQIESLITKKIEDEVSSLSLIDSITSYSLNSASIVIIQFDLKKNADAASQEVKGKLDAIVNSLPEGAQTPVLSKVDITATSVVNLVLSGPIEPAQLNEIASGLVKDSISRIEGVGQVNITGNQENEINVRLSNRIVYEHSLNLSQLAGIIGYSNLDMPGGNFQNGSEDYSVRLNGQIDSLEELKALPVPTSSGFRPLDQLASITSGPEEIRERVSFLMKDETSQVEDSVLISVIKSSEGNPVNIAAKIRSLIPELQKQFPENVSLKVAKDESDYIKGTVNDTLSNIIMGVVLTALIILLFLHNLRSTVIVALSMPMSIIPTFIVMNSMGISMNMLSLMGISISVGILVQNSVVVLENIFRHKSMGNQGKEAAAKGTGEVTMAVIASTLTNVCVFLPIGLMEGKAGVMLKDFAITIVAATLFSLLISFTLTPMLASLVLSRPEKTKNRISLAIENMFKSVETSYAKSLAVILKSRKRSSGVIGLTILLFVIAMIGFKYIPFESVPAMDTGSVRIEIELPNDASMAQTAKKVSEIEKIVIGHDAVYSILTNIGSLSNTDTGTNLATITIELTDRDLRENNRIVAETLSRMLATVTNAEIRVKPMTNVMSSMSSPVDFYLQSDNLKSLENNAGMFIEKLKSIPGLTSITTSLKEGKPEIVLTPERTILADMGLTVQDLAIAMRAAVEGLVLTQLKTENNEYDIRVSIEDADVSSIESISNLAISTRSGIFPLSHFAEVGFGNSTSMLLRVDKIPSIEFTAELLPGVVIGEVTSSIENMAKETLSEGTQFKWAGDAEVMKETADNMMKAFLIAVILTFMLLAAVLEKFGQPMLILSTVPLSLIGVVSLLIVTGSTMNMVSMLAIVMLVGLVVNNAILILDYANQLRREGMSVHDALLKACPTKLQPILMANLATVLGMMPMALGIGASGAEMRQPMGIVSIGGLLTATLLSLFVIPAIENSIEGKKTKVQVTTK